MDATASTYIRLMDKGRCCSVRPGAWRAKSSGRFINPVSREPLLKICLDLALDCLQVKSGERRRANHGCRCCKAPARQNHCVPSVVTVVTVVDTGKGKEKYAVLYEVYSYWNCVVVLRFLMRHYRSASPPTSTLLSCSSFLATPPPPPFAWCCIFIILLDHASVFHPFFRLTSIFLFHFHSSAGALDESTAITRLKTVSFRNLIHRRRGTVIIPHLVPLLAIHGIVTIPLAGLDVPFPPLTP